MSTTRTKRGATARFLALFASLSMMVAGLAAIALASPASATPARKVTICHATSAASNPYVTPTVDMSSVDEANNWDWNGHGDHEGPVFDPATMQQGDKWGDIIPPFTYTFIKKGKVVTVDFPGYNWSAEGQAIYNNGCAPQVPPVPRSESKYWCDAEGALQKSTSTSTDGGQTWSPWSPSIPSGTETSDKPMSCGEGKPIYQTLYQCAAAGSGVINELLQTSTDGGETWSPSGEGWSSTKPTNCGTEVDELYWCDANGNRVASTNTSINGGPWSGWNPQWPEGTDTSKNPQLECNVPVVPDLGGASTCEAGLSFTLTDWAEGTPFRITGSGARTGSTNGSSPQAVVALAGPLADGTYSSTLEIPYGDSEADTAAVVQPKTLTISVTCSTPGTPSTPEPPTTTQTPVTPVVVEAATVAAPAEVPAAAVPAPAVVNVPAKATLPAAVPAGEGSTGLPMWALAMIALGMIGAAAAGKQLLGARK